MMRISNASALPVLSTATLRAGELTADAISTVSQSTYIGISITAFTAAAAFYAGRRSKGMFVPRNVKVAARELSTNWKELKSIEKSFTQEDLPQHRDNGLITKPTELEKINPLLPTVVASIKNLGLTLGVRLWTVDTDVHIGGAKVHPLFILRNPKLFLATLRTLQKNKSENFAGNEGLGDELSNAVELGVLEGLISNLDLHENRKETGKFCELVAQSFLKIGWRMQAERMRAYPILIHADNPSLLEQYTTLREMILKEQVDHTGLLARKQEVRKLLKSLLDLSASHPDLSTVARRLHKDYEAHFKLTAERREKLSGKSNDLRLCLDPAAPITLTRPFDLSIQTEQL